MKIRLPNKLLLSKPETGYKQSREDQVMTWHSGMKESNENAAAVGPHHVPGWGPRELANT